jgi:aminobenzoyl-glutamate utilization protein B
MSNPSYIDDVSEVVEAARPAIERICAKVWDLAEISFHEVKSAEVHLRELKEAGFTIVSTGTVGVPTAFVAEWRQGAGESKVGFLAEYDALPGLGNAAVPRQAPRADGKTNGHGCGHNMLGAGLTGAAIAAKRVMEAKGIPGTLRVYGCAAEETEGAKVYMAREGLFNDLDACLHWHPAPMAGVINMRLAAANSMKVEFHGKTAHAGNEPWKGRSALDAMELAAHAVNQMREHLEPTARTHYIYEVAGQSPNVVPDYARMWLLVRDEDRARVVATTQWVKQIADGAALATQTRANINVYFGMHDALPNKPLAERMQGHLESVSTPKWTDEEQEFARECQKQMGLPEKGLATSVVPLQPEINIGGSSDVGDVSWITPTMGIGMATMPLDISLHTWPVTACGGMSIGLKGTLAAAKVLALTALDVLTDAELRAAARADFDKRTQGLTYTSPLPDEQKHPLELPDWLNIDGSVETMAEMGRQAKK